MQTRCKNNILKELAQIRALPQNQKCRDCILILDEHTSRNLSEVLSMEELLSFGIKDLCRVDKLKQPDITAFAIYYIEPQSLTYVSKDFEKQDIYFSVNILLGSEADQRTLHGLAEETKVIERLASFGELHLPCRYLGDHVSILQTFEHEEGLNMLPRIMSKQLDKTAEEYAKELFRALVAGSQLGINTCIKIYSYVSGFTEKVTGLLEQSLNGHFLDLRQELKSEQEPACLTGSRESAEIILVVADRQLDMISPLVRSFYYSPLMMDLFDIREHRTTIQIISDKISPTALSWSDFIFVKYSHMHLYSVFQVINDDLQNYIKHNKAARFQKQSQSNMKAGEAKELKQVMKNLPAYNRTIGSYNTNLDILGAIKKIIKERGLDELTELEHLVVTGMNGRREPEKDKKILQKVMEVAYPKSETSRAPLGKHDRCRLLLQTICCLNIGNDERAKLIQRLSEDSEYGSLATKISKIATRGIHKLVFPTQDISKSKEVYVDRHHTLLGNAVSDILMHSKTPKGFKLTQIGSVSKPKLKMFKAAPSVVVSMGGGLGYNELCNICQVFQNSPHCKEGNESVSFISDRLLNPSAYLKCLLGL